MMDTVAVLLACLAGAAWLATARAAEDLSVPPPLPSDSSPTSSPAKPQPAIKGACDNCGVIRSIRQVQRERPAREMPTYIGSPQYLDSRRYSEPHVGPVFGLTFGKGQTTQAYVGAAGSEQMRQRILEITYELTVRFDDGRFGIIELQDIGDFRVGDRVRVDGQQLEMIEK
jgi:hypothetical protein